MIEIDDISSPEDIRRLSVKELEVLCQKIRSRIIEVVSKNGGHLAPALGSVELVVAVNYVFETPKDIFVFDIGYQGYTHKLITGRAKYFDTLKIWKGLGGFLRPDESEYDVFGAGHAGTSISAALGIAEALKHKGEKRHVVALIGDGAMTAGLVYEALNNAGELKSDLLIILNDNGMSISPNTGAIASYFSQIMAEPLFYKLREKVKGMIREIFTAKGEDVIRTIRRIEEAIFSLFTPGILFEALGFYYFGPIDGHNLEEIIKVLRKVKEWKGPRIVHAKTKKGKGYPPAEKDPVKFHRCPPFIIETGEPRKKETRKSYSEVFGEFLVELARKDERIVAITAAMPTGTGLDKFQKEFPERFYDVGIAEQHAVTFSAGLVKGGMRPFTAIYSTFLQRAYDQIIHDVALQDIPVILCIDRAGLVGEDGPTHHGVFDIAYLRPIPNFVLMSPKDENELKDMMLTALNLPHPCAIRYPRSRVKGEREREPKELEVGKAEILKDGSDVVIFAYGPTVQTALEVAQELEKEEGINTAVVNLRFAKPLDTELILELSSRTGKVVTIEEAVITGGVGSAICELLFEKKVKADVVRVGVPDAFIEQGARDKLLRLVGLDKDGIKRAVLKVMLS